MACCVRIKKWDEILIETLIIVLLIVLICLDHLRPKHNHDFDHARVGVGVILKDHQTQKILVQKRRGSHGAGQWSLPGGHLEKFETLFACSARELKEEHNIQVSEFEFGPYTEDFFRQENRHYITLFLTATYNSCMGVPTVQEPDKCESFQWMTWEELQDMNDKLLFSGLRELRNRGYHPFPG